MFVDRKGVHSTICSSDRKLFVDMLQKLYWYISFFPNVLLLLGKRSKVKCPTLRKSWSVCSGVWKLTTDGKDRNDYKLLKKGIQIIKHFAFTILDICWKKVGINVASTSKAKMKNRETNKRGRRYWIIWRFGWIYKKVNYYSNYFKIVVSPFIKD